MQSVTGRVEWIDVFKALTICCVVIGHATGAYNVYIYQFHMAAFFFISGYTANLARRSFGETVWNKACTILLPMTTVFLLLSGLLAILSALFPALEWNRPFANIGFGFIFLQYFTRGNLYISWLGAAWFLFVLFGCFVVQKLIHKLSGGRTGVFYVGCSAVLFVVGYWLAAARQSHYLDLIFIAQFYVCSGVLVREANLFNRFLANGRINWLYLLLTTGGLYYFGHIVPATVDYPSRHFGGLAANYLAAMNGTTFLYLLSFYLTKAPGRIRQGLIWIGDNTIGILFFHFLLFKLGFLLLYLAGIVPLTYVQNFLPTEDISQRYAVLLAAISVAGSIAVWQCLNGNRWLRILLGRERSLYEKWYRRMAVQEWWSKVKTGLEQWRRIVLRRQAYCVYLAVFVILVCAPLLQQGIMCNDELQRRLLRWQGFGTLLAQGIQMELAQGRPMRILAPLQNALSYIGTNIFVFRPFQILLLLSNVALFTYFVNRVFLNRKFAMLVGIFLLLFLPITFEHAVPNAFVGLVAMPMNFLLGSFLAYLRYVERDSVASLALSQVLFFIAMMGYEFIVTFVLLFPVLWLAKTDAQRRAPARLIRACVAPFLLAGVFVGMTLFLQKFVNVNYDGAKPGFVSFQSSFRIIWTLFKSSFPGYYLFNAKYAYLYSVYNQSPLPFSNDFVQLVATGQAGVATVWQFLRQAGKALLLFVISNGFSVRIVSLWVFLPLLLFPLLNGRTSNSLSGGAGRYAVLIGLAYMMIPSLPNSLVRMYQGNVSERFFTSLPVSYFLYFSATVVLAGLVWGVARKCRHRFCSVALIVCICLYGSMIQSMNETFAQEQARNYQRLVSIERLFDTEAMRGMNNQAVYAPDLYATKNLLAVHAGYWTQYAKLKGLNLPVSGEKQRKGEMYAIFEQTGDSFVLCGGDEVVVLATKPLQGVLPVRIGPDEYVAAKFGPNSIDGRYFRTAFVRRTEESRTVLIPQDLKGKPPFAQFFREVGSTLDTARILSGYHKDGWTEKHCSFKIRTQALGRIILTGYYPNALSGSERVAVVVNGRRIMEYVIDRPSFRIEAQAPPNSDVTIELNSNFSFVPTNGDIRQLSFLLAAAEGK